MDYIIQNYQMILEQAALFLAGLVVFATVIVRIPGVGGDAMVDGVSAKIWKAISWLPTIGVNPQTKKLKEAYDDLVVIVETPPPVPKDGE